MHRSVGYERRCVTVKTYEERVAQTVVLLSLQGAPLVSFVPHFRSTGVMRDSFSRVFFMGLDEVPFLIVYAL